MGAVTMTRPAQDCPPLERSFLVYRRRKRHSDGTPSRRKCRIASSKWLRKAPAASTAASRAPASASGMPSTTRSRDGNSSDEPVGSEPRVKIPLPESVTHSLLSYSRHLMTSDAWRVTWLPTCARTLTATWTGVSGFTRSSGGGLPRVSRTVGPLKVRVQPEASSGAWLHHAGRSPRSSRTSCVVR